MADEDRFDQRRAGARHPVDEDGALVTKARWRKLGQRTAGEIGQQSFGEGRLRRAVIGLVLSAQGRAFLVLREALRHLAHVDQSLAQGVVVSGAGERIDPAHLRFDRGESGKVGIARFEGLDHRQSEPALWRTRRQLQRSAQQRLGAFELAVLAGDRAAEMQHCRVILRLRRQTIEQFDTLFGAPHLRQQSTMPQQAVERDRFGHREAARRLYAEIDLPDFGRELADASPAIAGLLTCAQFPRYQSRSAPPFTGLKGPNCIQNSRFFDSHRGASSTRSMAVHIGARAGVPSGDFHLQLPVALVDLDRAAIGDLSL